MQTTATFNGNVTIPDAEITQKITEQLQPVAQDIATRAKAIDENLLELTATANNTTFKHDRSRVSRKVFLTVNTTFSPTPPDNGWLHGDLGEIIVVHQADNLSVGVSGIADPAYGNAVQADKNTGSKWIFQYRIVDTDMVWEFKRINTAAAVVAKRYFVKGNGGYAHISVPTYNGTTPLISHDSGPVSILWAFLANENEKTGSSEILFSKGAGSSGTSQATISSAGLLNIGMGSDSSERITFPDSVFDNQLHHGGLAFKPGTANNGELRAALDGTIETRNDIPNMVYNTAPFNFLSLETGTNRFGTNAKLYYWYKYNRALTDTELVEALAGKRPADYVLGYTYINNANDISPNAIHGIITDGPVFGSENL